MSSPLNSWSASVKAGASAEANMITALQEHLGWVFVKHPNGKDVDLVGGGIIDIKALTAPYPSNPSPAGLSPDEHITLDVSNVEKYSDQALIVMVVDYTAADVPTKGIYYIPAGKVKQIMAENPQRVYSRSSRTSKDKVRKVAVSTRECGTWTFLGMTAEESVDTVMKAA